MTSRPCGDVLEGAGAVGEGSAGQCHSRAVLYGPDKLLREVKKKDCSPAMLSIAVSFLKLNEMRVSKAQGSVYTGLESLVRRSGLATPFTPSTSTTNKNDEEETEE